MIKIRTLGKSDIEKCIAIYKLNAAVEGWTDPAELQVDGKRSLYSELSASLCSNGFVKPYYFVAEIDNVVRGFAGYSNTGFDDNVFGLFWANVDPEFQNYRLGKELTLKRIDAIKRMDGKVIFSTTRKQWHLQRFGFKTIMEREDGYFLMQLNLD
jgi:predicted N-acetyltransferase YhbS